MRLLTFCLLVTAGVFAAEPVTSSFKARYNTQKLNFTESAVAMPESGMAFKLTPDQRSFGDWIEHTAGMNYSMCSSIAGVSAPKDTGVNGVQHKGKAAIEKAINESFAYCDKAFDGLTDAKALAEVQIGTRQVVPVDVMFSYVANLNAHYGNMVGYLRVKGVIPPSTARAQKAKK
ncbi:MAG: hypothetical protein FJW30_06335 [Acidobacteria bacterium]|nr:hypothetical protein [Acidobacteriota bacterium]